MNEFEQHQQWRNYFAIDIFVYSTDHSILAVYFRISSWKKSNDMVVLNKLFAFFN